MNFFRLIPCEQEMRQLEKSNNKNNKNSRNSLVFGRWPQAKIVIIAFSLFRVRFRDQSPGGQLERDRLQGPGRGRPPPEKAGHQPGQAGPPVGAEGRAGGRHPEDDRLLQKGTLEKPADRKRQPRRDRQLPKQQHRLNGNELTPLIFS